MAALSDEEMENLLSLADQISDDFRNGIDEIEALKLKLDAEVKNRQTLELTCASLKRENERLKNLRFEFLNNLTVHQQQRGESHGLREELKRLTDESIHKEGEHMREIESIKRNCDERIRFLEGQVREFSSAKAADEAVIYQLQQRGGDSHALREELKRFTNECIRKEEDSRKKIESIKRNCDERIRAFEGKIRKNSSQKAADEGAIYQLHHDLISCRNRLKDEEVKYQGEIEDLRDCIFAEQQEKEELSKKVRNMEKELLVTRTRMAEQHGSSSDKQLDAMKQKMMKLRKENEVLKRQLLASGKET